MLKLNQLKEFLDDIHNTHITQKKSLDLILGWVLKIDESHIDKVKSSFDKEGRDYELRLYAMDEKHCNLFISFIEQETVDIQLNHGAEYLDLQPLKSPEDFSKLDDTMRDILLFPLKEETRFCGERLIRASYMVNHQYADGVSPSNYTITFGLCMPWNEKTVIEKIYAPWIESCI